MFGWFRPKITDAMVERAARAMWDVWIASDVCRPEHRVSWDTMLAHVKDNGAAASYVRVGRQEARAALIAALSLQPKN